MAAPNTINIEPNGDVTLICGEKVGDGEITKLRVSSHILTRSSPVFKALLSPRFMEGTALANSSSVDIPLPEDEPKMMAALCNILHFQHDAVPDNLTSEEVMAFAELCDKYGCATAIKPSVDAWVAAILPTTQHNDRVRLLSAVMLLNHKPLAQRISVELAMKCTPSDTIPSKAANAVLQARAAYADCVETRIDEQLRARGDCPASCTATTILFESLLKQLKACQLWPTSGNGRTLEEICAAMENTRFCDPEGLVRCTENGPWCRASFSGPLSSGNTHFVDKARYIRSLVQDFDMV